MIPPRIGPHTRLVRAYKKFSDNGRDESCIPESPQEKRVFQCLDSAIDHCNQKRQPISRDQWEDVVKVCKEALPKDGFTPSRITVHEGAGEVLELLQLIRLNLSAMADIGIAVGVGREVGEQFCPSKGPTTFPLGDPTKSRAKPLSNSRRGIRFSPLWNEFDPNTILLPTPGLPTGISQNYRLANQRLLEQLAPWTDAPPNPTIGFPPLSQSYGIPSGESIETMGYTTLTVGIIVGTGGVALSATPSMIAGGAVAETTAEAGLGASLWQSLVDFLTPVLGW